MKDYKFTISGKDKTKAAFKSVKQGLKGVRAGINSTQLKIGVMVGASGFGAIVHSSINAGAELLKLSNTVNASVKELSAWQHAGKEVGIEGDKMADIFKDVQDKIGDFAVTGGGGAADMFEKLNLDIKEFNGLSAPDQLLKIGTALDTVSSKSEKIFFLEALAGDASRLLPLLENNSEGLKKLVQEADDLGISINRIEAEKLKEAQKAITDAGQAISGVGLKVSSKLAPYIVAATEKFTQMTLQATSGTDWITKGIDGVSSVIGVMANGLRGVEIIFQGVKIAGIGFGTAVLGAIKLVIDGVAFLGTSLKNLVTGPIGAMLEAGNSLGAISDTALESFNSIDAGLDFQTPQIITDAYTGMITTLSEENSKLHEMMMEPLPSEGITQTFESIKAGAVEAGIVIQENVTNKLSGGSEEDQSDEGERETARLQVKLDRIAQSHLTELEMIQFKEDQEIAILKQAEEQKIISHNEYLAKKLKTEQKYEAQRENLKKKTVASEGKAMGQINALSKSFGEKGAKISQMINLKQTVMDTHTGAMSAYKALAGIPIVGPALGAAAYAVVWAQGIKAQQGVKSMSGGGGGASAPSISTTPQQKLNAIAEPAKKENEEPGKHVIVNIYGDVSSNDADRLFEDIKQKINNEDSVLIESDSRNGQEIAAAGGI